MKYRKKPIIIEAVQINKIIPLEGQHSLPIWIRHALQEGKIAVGKNSIRVVTLEGVMLGQETDWLIKGIKGELYPCKDDIFQATYEACEATY